MNNLVSVEGLYVCELAIKNVHCSNGHHELHMAETHNLKVLCHLLFQYLMATEYQGLMQMTADDQQSTLKD